MYQSRFGSSREERDATNQGCSLVRGVVRDVVQDHPDAAAVRPGDEEVEALKGAEEGIDARMVGNVVAEVGHRGGVEEGDPDSIHPKPLEIIQPVSFPSEVPDAVSVGVLEGARVDLIDDAPLPPEMFARTSHHPRSLSARSGDSNRPDDVPRATPGAIMGP